MPYTAGTIERFWAKVDVRGADECWPWKAGCFDGGYGAFYVAGKTVRAHRFSFVLSNGPLDDGRKALHSCDNPPCCNPAHLFEGSNKDNVDDRHKKGRDAVGEGHGRAKITSAQVIAIREDRRSQRSIAKEYGICKSAVGYIKRGEHWSSVP